MSHVIRGAVWLYTLLLQLYPRPFLATFDVEMRETFRVVLERAAKRGALVLVLVWVREMIDAIMGAVREHARQQPALQGELQSVGPDGVEGPSIPTPGRGIATVHLVLALAFALLAGPLISHSMASPRTQIEQMAGVILPPSTQHVQLHRDSYLFGEYGAVARFTIVADDLPVLERALGFSAQTVGANILEHAHSIPSQYKLDWYTPDALGEGCCLYSNVDVSRSRITPAKGTADIQHFFVDTRDPDQVHVYVSLSAT